MDKKDVLADVAVLSVAGLVLAGVYFSLSPGLKKIAKALHGPRPQIVAAGTPADYDWTIESLDGQKRKVSDFKGKVIFLNFWATWCGPCRMEMPSIQALQEKFKDRDVVFLLVSNEKPSELSAFVEKKKWTLPVYAAAESPAFYNVTGIPTTYILSRDGRVALSEDGAKDWNRKPTVELLETLLQPATTQRSTAGTKAG